MKKIIFVLFLVVFCLNVFSQMTNVRKWRKGEKDSLSNALLLYEENYVLQALPIFENILNNHPKEVFIQYSFAKCALYRSDKHLDAYKYFSDIYAKNKKIEEIEYDFAKAAHYANKLDEAYTAINTYLSKKHNPENKSKGELLKRYINNALYFEGRPTQAKITNLGGNINSEGDEYIPSITADESTLFFTYLGPSSMGGLLNDEGQQDPNGSYREDIYFSKKQDNTFSAGSGLSNINTDANDAAVSLSHDGNTLFIYRDNSDDHGDLYESKLSGLAFTSPTKLKGEINSFSWDGHCSLSPDGRTLYFCSERGGGYGGRDIYKATMLSDSTWGHIVNLGDSINTSNDEDAPFIHADGVTLYFSSKGRSSMGGYDVFRSVMGADSTFKFAENLGYPINTTDDDLYFVIGANNKHAYYSSGREGGKGLKDIYSIDPAFNFKSPVYLVKGVVSLDKVPTQANIKVEITSKNNQLFKNLISNPVTGEYLVTLPAGANYKINFDYPGQTPQALDVDATSITDYTEKINLVMMINPVATSSGSNGVAASNNLRIQDSLALANISNGLNAGENKQTTSVETSATSKDGFVPQTKVQSKTMTYSEKYGDIKAEELEFRVQIGAFKNADNIVYPNLEGFGKIQKIATEEGLTKILIGNVFKTLRKAFEFNKKIIEAGQSDAFVTVNYKGKRTSFEELEQLGVFKVK